MPESDRVYVHIGLPKTGTTYLQRLLARNRRRLERSGVRYPGPGADHFFAAQDVLSRPFKGHHDSRIEGAWPALVSAVHNAPGSVILAHELLATARGSVIQRLVSDLAPRHVTVVATVRDLVRQVPAVWQEDVKNGSRRSFDEFLARVEKTATSETRLSKPFWKFQDGPGILAEWSSVPGVEIVVVTVPPAARGSHVLWERFATAVNIDPTAVDAEMPLGNVSLGAAETELLRSVNEWAAEALDWPAYRRLVKKTLGEEILAARRGGPRLSLPSAAREWAEGTSIAMADALEAAGYTVVGSLDELRHPPDGPEHTGAWPPPDADQLSSARDAVIGLLSRLAERNPS